MDKKKLRMEEAEREAKRIRFDRRTKSYNRRKFVDDKRNRL